MQISLSPIRSDARLALSIAGDILTVNGEAFDFGELPEGATLPRAAISCAWLVSDVERIGGVLSLTLAVPHGPNAPVNTLYPQSLVVADGPIDLPAYKTEDSE